MNITSRNINNHLIIDIQGNFDFTMLQEFRNAYQNINPQTINQVEVDMKKVSHVDSAALGMLLLLNEHFSGQRILLTNANSQLRQVFDIVNFSKKFDIR